MNVEKGNMYMLRKDLAIIERCDRNRNVEWITEITDKWTQSGNQRKCMEEKSQVNKNLGNSKKKKRKQLSQEENE